MWIQIILCRYKNSIPLAYITDNKEKVDIIIPRNAKKKAQNTPYVRNKCDDNKLLLYLYFLGTQFLYDAFDYYLILYYF